MPGHKEDQRLRPEEVLPPFDLLPEDLLPDDLLPEERDGLLFVVLLPLEPEDLVEVFFSPVLRLREGLLLVLLLLEPVLLLLEPVLLFPESLFVRAELPERVEGFLFVDLLRLLPVSLAFVSLVVRRALTRFSSSEPAFFRLVVPRWFTDPVVLRSYLLSPLSAFSPSDVRFLVRVEEVLFSSNVVLALRVAP